MKRLAILGASGHGKVVADIAERLGWSEIRFFDDRWPGHERNGVWPVVGDAAALLAAASGHDGVVVAIGDNAARLTRHRDLQRAGVEPVVLCHPSASRSPRAAIGAGSVLMAGAVVNVDSQLGEAVIINTGATVDHDCRLGDAVHLSPGAHLAGNVQVGAGSWIGIGAVVRQGVRIGSRVVVGAGAVVLNDVPDDATVVGVPARSR